MEPIQGDELRVHLEMLILATIEHGETHGIEILSRVETVAAAY